MGFKQDEDFARFLTMGAYGTAAIKESLESYGHRVIELERYAMSNKIWTVKVKRLRVPDLLCVDCGRRFESKAKSKFELKLSHSGTPGREWWAGGIREEDVFAFIRVVVRGSSPAIGTPVYVTRRALQEASADLKDGMRKAIADGSEADVSWPIWVPSYSGTVVEVTDNPQWLIRVEKENGGSASRKQGAWTNFHSYVAVGEQFVGATTAVAGTVQRADVTCAGAVWYWDSDITYGDDIDVYCAVKAAGFRPITALILQKLNQILVDNRSDWRLRLEVAGVLVRHGDDSDSAALEHLRSTALGSDQHNQDAMEAVFILGELGDVATRVLQEVASAGEALNSEVRAAAAWSLGQGDAPRPDALLDYIADENDLVALHAASAMPLPLQADVVGKLVGWLHDGSDRQMAVAAALLARDGRVLELVQASLDKNSRGRLFAIRYLGDIDRAEVFASGAQIATELESALDAIWIQHDDWLRQPETEGALDILGDQQVRF